MSLNVKETLVTHLLCKPEILVRLLPLVTVVTALVEAGVTSPGAGLGGKTSQVKEEPGRQVSALLPSTGRNHSLEHQIGFTHTTWM